MFFFCDKSYIYVKTDLNIYMEKVWWEYEE